MAQERRREHRIKASVPIRIDYGAYKYIGLTHNISSLGTFTVVDSAIPLGANVDIVLEIPPVKPAAGTPAHQVRCLGNVFRCELIKEIGDRRLYGIGIFFTGFAAREEERALKRYLEQLLSREKEGVKQGLKEWRSRRRLKHSAAAGSAANLLNDQVVALLKDVLKHTKEILAILKERTLDK